jgi:prevent-host-death family protein
MTMKQSIPSAPSSPHRVGVAEAKSKLSEVLRDAAAAPTIIHSRGRDLAVLIAIEQYRRLVASHPGSGAAFLGRVEAVKRRHGGGVEEFEPTPMNLRVQDPFSRPRATKRRTAT